MDITGNMLREYAEANGLEIVNGMDPDIWATRINENNGLCPCGKECPCDDCICTFYSRSEKTETEEPIEEPETTEKEYVIETEEIAKSIETIEKAKKILINMPTDSAENAARAVQEARDLIAEDAENHACTECNNYVRGLQRKLNFLKEECKKDSISCVMERGYTIDRMEEMQETFKVVDETVSKSEEDITEQQEEPEKAEILATRPEEKKEKSHYSGFHDCVRDHYQDKLSDLPRRERLCAAAKMCGNDKPPKEEAIRSCQEDSTQ